MVQGKVCAVVVTFNPLLEDLENLSKIRPQVQALVVVDNGSPQATGHLLRKASRELDFILIENGANRGIGAAMNTGGLWAEAHGFDWAIFFDQDSAATDHLVETMLRHMDEHGKHDNIGILVPKYQDRRSGEMLGAYSGKDGSLKFAMTSGSLIPISILQREGWFEEALFVGGVDFEYSLRLRSRGYRLKECDDALLLHAPAYPKTHKLFGIPLFTTSNYDAFRRYYSERNRVWLRRKYMTRFPGMCMALYWTSLKEYVKVVLGEEGKYKKLLYMGMGIVDGVVGRMGRNARL